MFASKDKINRRSNNSIVYLSEEKFFQIQRFFYDDQEKMDYVMGFHLNTCDDSLAKNYTFLKKLVSIDQKLSLFKTIDIKAICVLLEVNQETFIIPTPNTMLF